jgi:ubiquinone/menaquinone biosynthesis C-methylase UbiE
LFGVFPSAQSVLEVGCGTGHFSEWLAQKGLTVFGLDRSPAMLAEMHARVPTLPVILGDAHHVPLKTGAVDMVLFVTTLEFLEDPTAGLSEAVRIARQGVIALVLNRWSLGSFSRRWGPQAHQSLLSQAHDYSLWSLLRLVKDATGARLRQVQWASTLFPAVLWKVQGRIPLGDVIGMAAVL